MKKKNDILKKSPATGGCRSGSEEGFSLIEILVALAITSLLIGFASVIYLAGQKYFIRWEQSLELQNEIHTLVHGISEDIYQADEIVEIQPDELRLRIGSSLRTYYKEEDRLMRDSVSLLKTDIKLIEIKFGTSNGDYKAGDETRNMDNPESGKSTLIDLQLALANRQDTLWARRNIYLRKPSTWQKAEPN